MSRSAAVLAIPPARTLVVQHETPPEARERGRLDAQRRGGPQGPTRGCRTGIAPASTGSQPVLVTRRVTTPYGWAVVGLHHVLPFFRRTLSCD